MLLFSSRRAILYVFQYIWRIRRWQQRTFRSLFWWWQISILGRNPQFSKRPVNPALIGSQLEDFVNFVVWSVETQCETVTLYDTNHMLEISREMLLKRLRQHEQVLTIASEAEAAFSLLSVKTGRTTTVSLTDGREQYVNALINGTVTVEMDTKRLPSLLQTPKVDLLLVAGTDQLGDFPPLALRACEIYFVPSPVTYSQFVCTLASYARTEQRLGT